MNKLLGFAPDMDPTVPGVITDCTQLIPTERGMTAAPAAVDAAVVKSCCAAMALTNPALDCSPAAPHLGAAPAATSSM